MPDALAAMPEPFPDLAEYLEAFRVLCASRPNSGFGISAIPLSEIQSYCSLFGVEDRERFVYLVRAMDEAFIEKRAAKDGHDNSDRD